MEVITTEQESLAIRRRLKASRDKVFAAWTEPELLVQWWAVAAEFTPGVAEVDLRPQGRYRLGMKSPDGEDLIVTGEFKEIESPSKLIYTWRWEHSPSEVPDTLVTVKFIAHGNETEIHLTHEQFLDKETSDQHGEGWEGCINQLEVLLAK